MKLKLKDYSALLEQYIPLDSPEMAKKTKNSVTIFDVPQNLPPQDKDLSFKDGEFKVTTKTYKMPQKGNPITVTRNFLDPRYFKYINYEKTKEYRNGNKDIQGAKYTDKSDRYYSKVHNSANARDLIKIWNGYAPHWHDVIMDEGKSQSQKISDLIQITKKIYKKDKSPQEIKAIVKNISGLVKEFSSLITQSKFINQKYFNKWFRSQPITSDNIKSVFKKSKLQFDVDGDTNVRKPYRIFLPFFVNKLNNNEEVPLLLSDKKLTVVQYMMYNWLNIFLSKQVIIKNRDGSQSIVPLMSIHNAKNLQVIYKGRRQPSSMIKGICEQLKTNNNKAVQPSITAIVQKLVIPQLQKNVDAVDKALQDIYGIIPNKYYYNGKKLCMVKKHEEDIYNINYGKPIDDPNKKQEVESAIKRFFSTGNITEVAQTLRQYGLAGVSTFPKPIINNMLENKVIKKQQLVQLKIGNISALDGYMIAMFTDPEESQVFFRVANVPGLQGLREMAMDKKTSTMKYMVMVSRHPYDIFQASSYKQWSSCTQLHHGFTRYFEGTNADGIYTSGSQMNLVAYILPGDIFTKVENDPDRQYTLNKKQDVMEYAIGRVNIAPYLLKGTTQSYYWWTQNRLYTAKVGGSGGGYNVGQKSQLDSENKVMMEIKPFLNDWLTLKQNGAPTGTYSLISSTCYAIDHDKQVLVKDSDNQKRFQQIVLGFVNQKISIKDMVESFILEGIPQSIYSNFITAVDGFVGNNTAMLIDFNIKQKHMTILCEHYKDVTVNFGSSINGYNAKLRIKKAESCSFKNYDKVENNFIWSFDELKDVSFDTCGTIFFNYADKCQFTNCSILPSQNGTLINSTISKSNIGKDGDNSTLSRFEYCEVIESSLYLHLQQVSNINFRENCNITQIKKMTSCIYQGSIASKSIIIDNCQLYLDKLDISNGVIQNTVIQPYRNVQTSIDIKNTVKCINSVIKRTNGSETVEIFVKNSQTSDGIDTLQDLTMDLFSKTQISLILGQLGYSKGSDTVVKHNRYNYYAKQLGSGIIITYNGNQVYPNRQAQQEIRNKK